MQLTCRFVAATAVVVSCSPALIAQRVPLGLDLYVPRPSGRDATPQSVELGRRLFLDRRLSRDESVSCASCHDPARAFTDGRTLAVGVDGRIGRRHTPSLINVAYSTRLLWDGRASSLEQQVLMPIEDPDEMDFTVAAAAQRVNLSPEQLSHALASYLRSILAGDSRVDRFVAGDRAALSATEQAGLNLFRGKANCTACHVGPTFSDNALHNTGIAWRAERLIDQGGGNGSFKTPTLREISRTAPYMHDGSIPTLDEVVDYYDRGGNRHPLIDPEIRPLRLAPDERRQLRAFLEALVGKVRRDDLARRDDPDDTPSSGTYQGRHELHDRAARREAGWGAG